MVAYFCYKIKTLNTIKRHKWILLGIFAIVFGKLLALSPKTYECFYFKGLFQVLRVSYDFTFGLLPFGSVYILFLTLLSWLIYRLIRWKDNKYRLQFSVLLSRILSFAGVVIFFFYFLWGYNYVQPPIEKIADLPSVQPDTSLLFAESKDVLHRLENLRNNLTKDTFALGEIYIPDGMESIIRKNLEHLLASWDIPVYGRVRVRRLLPEGLLLRISTAGVYIPFVMEGHIDGGLHTIQLPFTMAHEMSHGYGLTDEGACNFTGMLACISADEAMIQYSGYLGLWRYMSNNLRRSAPYSYKALVRDLPRGIYYDLVAIDKQMDKFPDILPDLRDMIYDTYLKSHGVHQGLHSYNRVVALYLAWKSKHK